MHLALVLAALLLAATVPPAARDPGVARLAPDSESRWVPFDLTPGNQIRFTMRLDDRDVVAILDTGVSVTLLASTSPAVDPATLVDGGTATAIGGTVPIRWMPVRALTIGGLTRTGGGVTVADLPAIATGGTAPVDLLVGADLLATHALDIDYAGRRFRLLPSGRLPFAGESAPLSIVPARRVYESAIRLGGRRVAPMVVDTGDGSAITVTTPGWRAAGLSVPTTTTIGFGLGGQAVSRLAIVPALQVGDVVARATEIRIEPDRGFSQSIGVAGRIGTGFLQRYRVLLDPGAKRMVLARAPGAETPPLRSTSGLLLGLEPDRLKVLHVMANGPAAAAGWQAGDTICAVDGAAVTLAYATSPAARWSAGTPGRVVRLTPCNGPVRTLTLRNFY